MKTWVWINNNDTVVRILGISGSCSLIKTFSLNKFNHPLGNLLQPVKSDLTALLSWLLSRGTKENEKVLNPLIIQSLFWIDDSKYWQS
jgi:hypothetical protein